MVRILCYQDRLEGRFTFILDSWSCAAMKIARTLIAEVGDLDLLAHKNPPGNVTIWFEITDSNFHRWRKKHLLPRAKLVAQMLTGLSTEMLDKIGGAHFVNHDPHIQHAIGKSLWSWELAKKNCLGERR